MSIPRVLAVDCGAGHLACGLLSSDKSGRLQLEKLALDAFNPDASLDSEWAAMIGRAVGETVAREKFSGQATIGLPGHHILGRVIKTPSVEESKRAKIVQFEAQQNIPYPLDEVVWDYQVVAEHGMDLELMLAAAKKEVVQGACDSLSDAGLSVVSVLPSSIAVTRCFRYNYPEVSGSFMIADIGARSTNLIFADSERFFVRTINNIAGNSITQLIADELKHDFTHCETIKVQVLEGKSELPESSPARAAVRNAVSGFISKLHLELTRSIVNYRRQSGAEQPATLYLTGGGSLLADLPVQLQERLKIQVERLDPLRNVTVLPSAGQAQAVAPVLASLIGLAIPAEKGRKSINLLPYQIASRLAFNKRQPLLLAAAALVVVAMVPPLVQSGRLLAAARQQSDDLTAAIMPIDSNQRKIKSTVAAVEDAKAEILAVQSLAESKNNWSNFFTDLQDRLVKEQDVWLESLQVLRASAVTSESSGGGMFGETAAEPVEPQLDENGNPIKPPIRLQLSGRLLDRNNPVSLVSSDSYNRVKSLLASFVDSDFISAVEKESFDANTPGILRFDFILVIDPARPL